MKTTVDIADPIYRQIKARAALSGQSMRKFINDAIIEKLQRGTRAEEEEPSWRGVFGKAPAEAVEELQAIIDEEFSRIDLERWS